MDITARDLRLVQQAEANTDGCWKLPQKTFKRQRGEYQYVSRKGKRVLAHRLFYELFIGPIPEGAEVDHTCNVMDCVNPDHLEAVTKLENNRRRQARRTHCPKGHVLMGDNVKVTTTKTGTTRQCRTCLRDYHREYYQRRKS